jgi:cytoskeletal protein RodZ
MIRIGTQFREERRRRGLTLEEISKATKIREEFLKAIEEGDYKRLPSAAYAHGFVSNYAKYLGLSVEKSLALFRREFDEKKSLEVLPKGLSRGNQYVLPRFRIGRTSLLIVGLVFIIFAFLVFQYRSAFLNPSLNIENPKENQVVSSQTIEVKGSTDPNSTLTIEGEQVPVDSDGKFRKEITVFPGDTSITAQAENKFGRITLVERKIKTKLGD